MKNFLLKLYTIYKESNRKAADTEVLLLLFSLIPVPNINIYYWTLTGLKKVLTSHPNVVKVIDVIIDIYFQNIPIPIFISLFIAAVLYFIKGIYKNRTEFISAKLYGCKIDSKFFKAINDRAIATLGERYSPIIHVENEELDTLYKIVTEQIDKQDIINLLISAIREESKVDTTIDEGVRTECLRKLQMLSEMNLDDIDSVWFDELYSNIDELSNQYIAKAREIRKEKTHHFDSTKLDNFRDSISNLYDYRNNGWFKALVEPAIAVIGEAGIGKSHLLADIMSKRESHNLDSILLLGQWFSNQNTLKDQILSQLSLRCNFEEFLEVLNLYGEKRKRKTYILIDALNEGQISSWETELPSLISDIKRYKFIGIIFSSRRFSESDTIISTLCTNCNLVYTHNGFSGFEYEAAKQLFDKYQIPYDAEATTNYNFYNPLFLKIYCESYSDRSVNRLNSGFYGVLLDYLKKINDRIANKNDITTNVNITFEVCKLVGLKLLENGRLSLKYTEALEIVNEFTSQHFSGNYLDLLIEENVFACYDRGISSEKTVVFHFQRFDDYIKAILIIDGAKGRISSDIWDAVAIILPIIKHKEIFEVNSKYEGIFLRTLDQRYTLSDIGFRKIAEYLDNEKYGIAFEAIGNLLGKSSTANRAVELLNTKLFNVSLSERDYIWTTYISKFGVHDDNPYYRLFKWCLSLSEEQINCLGDSVVRAISYGMIWCLSASHRTVRDLATKSLVALLSKKLYIMPELLDKFKSIDDPYIAERLYAVCLGCSHRTIDMDNLCRIANFVYETVFNQDEVYPNILLRDYARGVIEQGLKLGLDLQIEIDKIMPPYKSYAWSIADCPSNDYVTQNYFIDRDQPSNDNDSQNRIIYSMITNASPKGMYGDFGRYVFESEVSKWSYDVELLSNYALKLIFEKYRYDYRLFNEYDSSVNSYDRSVHKRERIGKKLQWIAKNEVLALISDNSPIMDNRTFGGNSAYVGPWEPSVRDIDPTIIYADIFYNEGYVIKKEKEIHKNKFEYKFPSTPLKKWQQSVNDISADTIKRALFYDENGKKWVKLLGYNRSKDAKIDKEIWLFSQAYFVNKNDVGKAIKYIHTKGTKGRRMPEMSNGNYELFYKEYFDSLAYQEYSKQYEEDNDNLGFDYVLSYYNISIVGGDLDGSLHSSRSYYIPSKDIVDVLSLKSNDMGLWYNETGDLVCFDYAARFGKSSSLYIDASYLNEYLRISNKVIIWPILGEKSAVKIKTIEQFGGAVYYKNIMGICSLRRKIRSYDNELLKQQEATDRSRDNYYLIWYLLTNNNKKRRSLHQAMLNNKQDFNKLYLKIVALTRIDRKHTYQKSRNYFDRYFDAESE